MAGSTSETNFSNQKEFSPNTKKVVFAIVEIIIISILAIFVLFLLIPIVQKYVKNYTVVEIITIITLILTLAKCVWNIGKSILSNCNAAKKSMALTIETYNEYTIITCKIANRDTRRIKPKDIYLFVEKGVQPTDNDEVAKFPFLLCHESNNKDCELGAICKLPTKLTEFPDHIIKDDKFKSNQRMVIRLDELCQEGRHYIDPGEEFSEDVTMKFKDCGVYRATVIWTSERDDCICASKEFVVIKKEIESSYNNPCTSNVQLDSSIDCTNST